MNSGRICGPLKTAGTQVGYRGKAFFNFRVRASFQTQSNTTVQSTNIKHLLCTQKPESKMQRFKALLPQQTRSSLRTFCSHRRAFSAQPNYSEHHDDDSQEQILVEGRAKSRAAILNRPSSLNSLNASMVARLKRLYDSWEENSDIGFVLMKGSGRAFCSGADVVRLYQSLNEASSFRTCMKILWAFMQVAILDGITMGCGSGISLPGMFRVVTDKTIFSHPETQIGFHPDAGASYILSRLPGYLGEYLALTGDKLNGVEMIACRLATHYSLNARLALLEERLGKLITDEPSVVEASLAQYGDLVYPDRSSVLHRIDTIDRCFSQETVEEIIEALIREGRFETLDKCLIREYRMSLRGISKLVSSDFFEGVRARMVDKDFAPKYVIFMACLEGEKEERRSEGMMGNVPHLIM
ncbi:hypothetical protein JHK84_039789 [Glycine max]|nr:hypothetical protein JHK84_039789 [Glycine max]